MAVVNASREKLMQVILEPRITEKSASLSESHGQYVFRVLRDVRKPEIKQAVEMLFEVEVASVQVCNVKGKTKVHGRYKGRRPDWKKAYITLKPGFNIDYGTS